MTLVEAIFVGPQRGEGTLSGAARKDWKHAASEPTAASERGEVPVAPNAHGQLAAVRDSIVTAADDLILIASSRNLPDQSRYAGRSAHRVAIENWPVT